MSAITGLLPRAPNGHSMLQIADALRTIGFRTEGRRETLDGLRRQAGPCIAHLTDPEHFVVVVGVGNERVHLFDG
jgi:ABC-type bacteriocin/lantibiotic exporter with double-glycine peptidase domain